MPASRCRMAFVYAFDSTVAFVATTPTRLFLVACAAARAPGSTTPMTGTGNVLCACANPAAVAVLQAMTIAFAPSARKRSAIERERSNTSSSVFSP